MGLCRIVGKLDFFFYSLSLIDTDTHGGIEVNLTLKTHWACKKMSYCLQLYTYKVDQQNVCVLYRIHTYCTDDDGGGGGGGGGGLHTSTTHITTIKTECKIYLQILVPFSIYYCYKYE